MSDFLILLLSGDLEMDAAGGSRSRKPRAVRRLSWHTSDLQMAAFDWNAAAIHPKQNYYRRYRVTSWPASMMAWAWHGIARRPAKAKHAMTHQIRGGPQDLSRTPAPLLIGRSAPGTDASPRWVSRKLEQPRAIGRLHLPRGAGSTGAHREIYCDSNLGNLDEQ